MSTDFWSNIESWLWWILALVIFIGCCGVAVQAYRAQEYEQDHSGIGVVYTEPYCIDRIDGTRYCWTRKEYAGLNLPPLEEEESEESKTIEQGYND